MISGAQHSHPALVALRPLAPTSGVMDPGTQMSGELHRSGNGVLGELLSGKQMYSELHVICSIYKFQ